jgi:hypothetical protein
VRSQHGDGNACDGEHDGERDAERPVSMRSMYALSEATESFSTDADRAHEIER